MNSTPCTGGTYNSNYKFSFEKAARCYAKTRRGYPCKSPAIKGKRRCRMHGGKGSGAPKGNQNAFKHGHSTFEAKERRKQIQALLNQSRELIKKLKI